MRWPLNISGWAGCQENLLVNQSWTSRPCPSPGTERNPKVKTSHSWPTIWSASLSLMTGIRAFSGVAFGKSLHSSGADLMNLAPLQTFLAYMPAMKDIEKSLTPTEDVGHRP